MDYRDRRAQSQHTDETQQGTTSGRVLNSKTNGTNESSEAADTKGSIAARRHNPICQHKLFIHHTRHIENMQSLWLCYHKEKYTCALNPAPSVSLWFCASAFPHGSSWSQWPEPGYHIPLRRNTFPVPVLLLVIVAMKDQDTPSIPLPDAVGLSQNHEVLSRLHIHLLAPNPWTGLSLRWETVKRRGNGGTSLQAALPVEAGSDAAALPRHRLPDGRQHPAPAALQHQGRPAQPRHPAAHAVPSSASHRPQDSGPGREGPLQMGRRSVCLRRGSQGRAALARLPQPRGPTLASPLVSQSAARESRAESPSAQEQQAQG